jgi:Fe-Mn family superoxide dismutase
MTSLTRRQALSSFAASGIALQLSGQAPQDPTGKPGTHAIKPLPFDPSKLTGLSEKLLVSHHANNYSGAVKNLNKVEAELANVGKDTPPFVVAGLKERELSFRNSATLHELYFGNLGGDGKLAGGIAEAVAQAFGSTARFEELLRAAAMSLAGGSGWVVLGHDLHRDGLALGWSGGHPQNLAATLPLCVLDMYEHSFHLDFGAAAAKYVDAFMSNLNWQEVDRRLAASKRAMAALRG